MPSKVYDRQHNTTLARRRREAHRASYQGQPISISLSDDSNDTATRIHTGCGARCFGVVGHFRTELIRCEAGHRVKAGDWTIVAVRPVEARCLPACDVGDRIVVEAL